ncbi:MAG: GTPase, partial [Candidatus Dormibacteraceae bacterium]
ETVVSSRMFATLDPTVRAISLESRRAALLSDTVGFIRHLPPHLVTAFRATLEELQTADLLLHVIDASHPLREQQTAAVENQIETLGLAQAPRLRVWNKIDLADPVVVRSASQLWDVAVSAWTGEGMNSLLASIDQRLTAGDPMMESEFKLPLAGGEALAALHRLGTVLSTRFEEGKLVVHVRLRVSCRDHFCANHVSLVESSRQVVEIQHL